MEKLALFDVDFTITRKETLLQFYLYCIKENKGNIKYLPRILVSGLLYLIKIYDEKKLKQSFLKFIQNMDEKEVYELSNRYYNNVLKNILYQDGIDMIKKLKKEGYKVILISASPEFYLKELYDIKEIDMIIGSKFIFEDGKFTSKMEGLNCKGKEKVRRLNEFIKEKNIEPDYKNSYMFSDSLSDSPLLEIVGNPFLINYNKKAKYKVLKWK